MGATLGRIKSIRVNVAVFVLIVTIAVHVQSASANVTLSATLVPDRAEVGEAVVCSVEVVWDDDAGIAATPGVSLAKDDGWRMERMTIGPLSRENGKSRKTWIFHLAPITSGTLTVQPIVEYRLKSDADAKRHLGEELNAVIAPGSVFNWLSMKAAAAVVVVATLLIIAILTVRKRKTAASRFGPAADALALLSSLRTGIREDKSNLFLENLETILIGYSQRRGINSPSGATAREIVEIWKRFGHDNSEPGWEVLASIMIDISERTYSGSAASYDDMVKLWQDADEALKRLVDFDVKHSHVA